MLEPRPSNEKSGDEQARVLEKGTRSEEPASQASKHPTRNVKTSAAIRSPKINSEDQRERSQQSKPA